VYNPFAPGFPRGFAPSGFGPGFGSYPFPGIYCKDIADDQQIEFMYFLHTFNSFLSIHVEKLNTDIVN